MNTGRHQLRLTVIAACIEAGMTPREIAEQWDISRQRVDQFVQKLKRARTTTTRRRGSSDVPTSGTELPGRTSRPPTDSWRRAAGFRTPAGPPRCARVRCAWKDSGCSRNPSEKPPRTGRFRALGTRQGTPRATPGAKSRSRWRSRGTGCGAAWLARLTGGQEVPGSNPGSPTMKVQVRCREGLLHLTCETSVPALSPCESWLPSSLNRAQARRKFMSVVPHGARTIPRLRSAGRRPHRVHGVGRRAQVAWVEVGVGAEVGGRIVAKGGGPSRHGDALLGHEIDRHVSEHMGRGIGWEPGLFDGRPPDAVPPVGSRTIDPSAAEKIGTSRRSVMCSTMRTAPLGATPGAEASIHPKNAMTRQSRHLPGTYPAPSIRRTSAAGSRRELAGSSDSCSFADLLLVKFASSGQQ